MRADIIKELQALQSIRYSGAENLKTVMNRTTIQPRIFLVILILLVLFAATRALGTLGPAAWRWLLPTGFVLMALTPWLILDAPGRRRIGLTPVTRKIWYGWALMSGAAAALICFAVGHIMFGTSTGNWYVSIAGSYQRMMDTSAFSIVMLHLVFTTPALLFSPVGEEIFFRGVLQRALEDRTSTHTATMVECSLFAVVHLCHHGLVRIDGHLGWMPLSALSWMLLMFVTAWLFAWIRKRSGSLYPAIAAHMAFNGTMNFLIFQFLWPRAA